MLPFARMLQYDNVIPKNWYDNSLIALDSTKLFDNTNQDYFGTATTKTSTMPKGTTVNYGFDPARGFGGRNSDSGDYVAFNTGTSLASLSATGWTLDYWYNYTGNVSFAFGHVLFAGYTSTYPDYPLLCINPAGNGFRITENTGINGNRAGYEQPTTVLSTEQAYYKPNTVQHLAIQCDGTTTYLFINGVAILSTTSVAVKNIMTQATGTRFAIYPQCTYNNNGRTIERVRLRAGAKFDIAGFDPQHIYPDQTA